MRWQSLVPDVLKRALRPIYHAVPFLPKRPNVLRPRHEIHAYWKKPHDGKNLPGGYLQCGQDRSKFLFQLIEPRVERSARILEIGCNAGRNLAHLFEAGFTQLSGIEISADAIEVLKGAHPDMAARIALHVCPVEEKVRTFVSDEFDVVYTMAVLVHLHPESEWVFAELARITRRYLITIEDEHSRTWRHFPRKYREIFERLGMKQVEEVAAGNVPGMREVYVARVFEKE